MSLVEVEITGQAITAQYGTLETGTFLRTSAEFAKHLVEEAHCARYTTAQPAEGKEAKVPEAPKKRLTKAEKAAAEAQAADGAATEGDAAEAAVSDASEESAAAEGEAADKADQHAA